MQCKGDGVTFDSAALKAGAKFATPYENGCVVTVGPDDMKRYEPDGAFLALDSDGVECQFHTSMVSWIHR